MRRLENLTDLARIAKRYAVGDWIFRGVTDAKYTLVPKIGRPGMRKDKSNRDAGYSEQADERAMARFRREARPFLPFEPNEMQWLAIAQHHGMYTRLLDWTESPFIAAFFAVYPAGLKWTPKGIKHVRAKVIAIRCPKAYSGEEDPRVECEEAVLAYYPHHVAARISAQRSLFTWHRHPAQEYKPVDIKEWFIPSNRCYRLKVELNRAGFNMATMFPGLDGIADHVAWLYKRSLLDVA